MAKVYLAVQQSLGREIALKVLSSKLAQDADASERFLREARLAANLHHPHIVPIYDVGAHEGIAYIAMQFEPGGTVSSLAGVCDSSAALRIIRDIASALDYAHDKGVVHRDIKPDNILRRTDGSCVLSDFGIARVIESETVLTREGTSIGTPQYMSPEQLRGEKVDGRADLYSLGVVLYQLLTGELPYAGSDGWAIGMQHINADIPRLPLAMARMQPLVDNLMAKNAGARPQTGAEVVRQIDALLAFATPAATVPLAAATPKPRHLVSRNWLLLGAISLVLAISVIALWQLRRGHPASNQPAIANLSPRSTLAPAADKSIAVLPFEDMSQERDQGYFSDGMSEELLNLLAQVPGLHVAGRTSTLAFKGKSATIEEIGKTLNVATVLEGSVRKAGDNLRVTAQLINVVDGFQLWSQSYDRKLTNVFAVQDDIAGAVVDALKLKLLPGQRPSTAKHHVPSFEAYDHYLRGRKILGGTDSVGYSKAIEAFRQAVVLDPEYAVAYAGLGMAESFAVEENPNPTLVAEGNRRAMAAAEHAVALDPELGDAYSARGYLRGANDWDWDGALADQLKAVSLDPGDAKNQLRYGYLLATLGRLADARVAFGKGIEDDPLFVPVWYQLGRVKAAQADYTGARLAMNRVLAINPENKLAASYLGALSLLQGDAVTAREIFAKLGRPLGVALAEHDLHHFEQSKHALDQLIATHAHDSAYAIATAYAWSGDRDQAFVWLERAVVQHDGGLLYLKFDPLLRGLRDDARYKVLLRKLRLPE